MFISNMWHHIVNLLEQSIYEGIYKIYFLQEIFYVILLDKTLKFHK
jgi:hypothetical protein